MQDFKISENKIIDMPVWGEIERAYGYSIDDPDERIFLWNSAKSTYLNLRYPFDMTISEIPFEEKERGIDLVQKLILDYLERRGLTSATSYSENGIHWSFDSAGTSKWLVMQIKSRVYIPKKR